MKPFIIDLLLEKRNENDLDNAASRVYILSDLLRQQYQTVMQYLFFVLDAWLVWAGKRHALSQNNLTRRFEGWKLDHWVTGYWF